MRKPLKQKRKIQADNVYNSTKVQKVLGFKYSMTLEERFVLFAKQK